MRHTYLFVGLTPSERALLESLFALDAGHGDEMVPARSPGEAHLVVANGDDAAVVQRLRAEHPRALIVLVGRPAGQPGPALPVLQRPLDVAAVVGVFGRLDWPAHLRGGMPSDFDSTFAASGTAAGVPAPTPGAGEASAFAPTTLGAPLAAQAPEPVSARASWAHSELGPPAGGAATGPAQAPDVLVVVGALGERSHTLPQGLQRLGLRVQLVPASEALARFARQPVDFVLLDQASLGEGLLPLARALRAGRAAGGPPHVVVVARQGSAFDRLRARTLGCSWMTVPIDRERLAAFFAHRGRSLPR